MDDVENLIGWYENRYPLPYETVQACMKTAASRGVDIPRVVADRLRRKGRLAATREAVHANNAAGLYSFEGIDSGDVADYNHLLMHGSVDGVSSEDVDRVTLFRRASS